MEKWTDFRTTMQLLNILINFMKKKNFLNKKN